MASQDDTYELSSDCCMSPFLARLTKTIDLLTPKGGKLSARNSGKIGKLGGKLQLLRS
jgi:hypothetical protein